MLECDNFSVNACQTFTYQWGNHQDGETVSRASGELKKKCSNKICYIQNWLISYKAIKP